LKIKASLTTFQLLYGRLDFTRNRSRGGKTFLRLK